MYVSIRRAFCVFRKSLYLLFLWSSLSAYFFLKTETNHCTLPIAHNVHLSRSLRVRPLQDGSSNLLAQNCIRGQTMHCIIMMPKLGATAYSCFKWTSRSYKFAEEFTITAVLNSNFLSKLRPAHLPYMYAFPITAVLLSSKLCT